MDDIRTYLLGRANRREYWIGIVCMTVATIAVNMVVRKPVLVSGLSFLPWVVIAGRRLRDFGWSAWWSTSTLAAGFVIGLIAGFVNVAAKDGGGGPLLAPVLLTVLYGVTNWSIIIYIGSRKGVAGPSRDRRAVAQDDLARTFD